jgi:exopolyphosphatase / guanosine-5'-triphosphate,3'-diphosphate pyrophosphatase
VRIAAIDIGTNSIHMVIAQAQGAGFQVVDREREVVQVGRGSFAGNRLRTEAIQRTADALARYVKLARRHQVDHIVCTATAAVREARNGGAFVQACREAAGITPRVIPGEEEGRLIYLGVKSALQLDDKPALMVDIGGGSMQLVVGDRDRMHHAVSAPLGALRLTEMLLDSDPPARRDLQRLRRQIRKHAREALETVLAYKPERVYGSSGAIHALAQIAHVQETGGTIEHINGHVLSTEALARVVRRLQRMTLAERERLQGLDAKRAEIIVPGAMVLLHVLEEAGADGITMSDFGVREGLVTDYILSHAREVSSLQKVEDLRLRSVLELLTKFQVNERHARHVGRLSLMLFDALRSVHALDAGDRDLLQYAALLHDIGAVIGYDGHGDHSYYIIRNGNLRGLSAEEVEVVATVARYHGQRRPRKRDRAYASLPKPRRRAVKWMAALLRIAEGLDRSHYQLVRDLRVARRGRRVAIMVAARRDARLELWAARRRTGLLEELLDGRVTVRLDPAVEAARKAEKTPRPDDEPAARVSGETDGKRTRLAVVPPRTGSR